MSGMGLEPTWCEPYEPESYASTNFATQTFRINILSQKNIDTRIKIYYYYIMIIDGTLISSFDFMTDFNGIDRHFPNPQYPAGVYEPDKPRYKHGPESSEYPNLLLPCELYDEYGDVVPQGYYMVVLSFDRKYLELYQSNTLKARVRVLKVVEQMYTREELNEEMEITGRLRKAQMKKNLKKIAEAEEELKAFKEKTAAGTYAEIEDSGNGYYILKYNCNGKKVTGIIQK